MIRLYPRSVLASAALIVSGITCLAAAIIGAIGGPR